MVEKVASHFNHSLSVVVNNNAILSPESGGSANIDDDSKFRAIMGDNVMAAVRFSQLSVPYLAKASARSGITHEQFTRRHDSRFVSSLRRFYRKQYWQ